MKSNQTRSQILKSNRARAQIRIRVQNFESSPIAYNSVRSIRSIRLQSYHQVFSLLILPLSNQRRFLYLV